MKTLIAILATCLALHANASGYIEIEGVKGESKDTAQSKAQDYNSSRSNNSSKTADDGLPTGKRQHKPVTITKPVDKATPMMAKKATTKKPKEIVVVGAKTKDTQGAVPPDDSKSGLKK